MRIQTTKNGRKQIVSNEKGETRSKTARTGYNIGVSVIGLAKKRIGKFCESREKRGKARALNEGVLCQ